MAQYRQSPLNRARFIASIAATAISLACGTNYVYSAWAPQFAEKLKLTATQSNLIGLAGNLGMYSLGVPVGIILDKRGPRPFVILGAIVLAAGYFPLHIAYDKGSGSVAALCFFSFLSGLGGCMAFAAAIKTSALNWPSHRGTATAFPLAAFGLSAFFFSTLGALVFPGDPSGFLKLLAWGTSSLTTAGFFFLKVYPDTHYRHVSPGDRRRSSSLSARMTSRQALKHDERSFEENGTSPSEEAVPHATSSTSASELGAPSTESDSGARGHGLDEEDDAIDETSSLVSSISDVVENVVASSVDTDRSHRIDIRGTELFQTQSFWLLFGIMAILAGIGLMTINNIGNDANALWKHYDESVSEDFLVHRQQMHVSILSVCSFIGRLLSGVGSDFLVRSLHASRLWCLFVASLVFVASQAIALVIENPHFLGLVSGLSGLAYGFLFGVFPSLVAEAFGIRGLSQNWGFMTLAPVLSSNLFNLFYGRVLDAHSNFDPDGRRSCHDGLECYKNAYWVTFSAGLLGIVTTLWAVRHEHVELAVEARKSHQED